MYSSRQTPAVVNAPLAYTSVADLGEGSANAPPFGA